MFSKLSKIPQFHSSIYSTSENNTLINIIYGMQLSLLGTNFTGRNGSPMIPKHNIRVRGNRGQNNICIRIDRGPFPPLLLIIIQSTNLLDSPFVILEMSINFNFLSIPDRNSGILTSEYNFMASSVYPFYTIYYVFVELYLGYWCWFSVLLVFALG